MRLAGKTAIVTGAGSGIGRATALRFAKEGAAVACAGLSADDNVATVRAIEAAGGSAVAIEADVMQDEDVDGMVAAAIQALSHVDILVNNAGQAVIGSVEEVERAGLGPPDGCQRHPASTGAPRRSGPTCASAAAARSSTLPRSPASSARPGQVAYATSKGAVVMLTKCLALDGAKDQIRVNCVLSPAGCKRRWWTITSPNSTTPEGFKERLARLHPLGVGDPADIAGGFVYLASGRGRWVTGIALTIDGGVSCGLVPE